MIGQACLKKENLEMIDRKSGYRHSMREKGIFTDLYLLERD